jgi:hypothetical protein
LTIWAGSESAEDRRDGTMQKTRSIYIERLQKFTQQALFSPDNLRSVLTKKKTSDGITLSVFAVPDLKRM